MEHMAPNKLLSDGIEKLRSEILKHYCCFDHDYAIKHISWDDEIIARLFVKIYGMYLDSNIHKYQKGHQNPVPEDDNDTLENNVKRMRREMKKAETAKSLQIEHLAAMGHYNTAQPFSKQGKATEIPIDEANLIMVDTQFMHKFQPIYNNGEWHRKQINTFIDIISKHDVSSNHVTEDDLLNAFAQIDEQYDCAKRLQLQIDEAEQTSTDITDFDKTKAQIEYIDQWVNFHRMETALSVSLISKIADYMIENNISDFPNDQDLIALCWGTVEIGWQTTLENNNGTYTINLTPCSSSQRSSIFQPIALLRYDKYIKGYCSSSLENNKDRILQTRIESGIICSILTQYASKVFETYFRNKNDSETVNVMYNFCKNSYPIISSHESYRYCNSNELRGSQKAKLLRKILDVILPNKKIKQYFGK